MEEEPRRRMATRAMTQQQKLAEAAMESSEENNDNTQAIDYFNSLPDELLIFIFSFLPHNQLPRCSMVCPRWLRITFDESLWNRTKLRNVKIPLFSLAKLVQRGIRHLDIRLAEVVDPQPWKRCFPKKYKSKLEALDTSLTRISNRGLAHLLRPCHKLQSLESIEADLNRLGCEAIANNSELQTLNLCESRGLDARGLSAILKGCRKLTHIYLDMTNLSLEALNAVIANLSPSLTVLSLLSCSTHLQDNHVFDIVDRCPNLRFLNISSNDNLTQAAFDRARTLKHLEELVYDNESWNWNEDDFDDDSFFDDSDPFYDDESDIFPAYFPSDSDDDDYDVGNVYAMDMDDLNALYMIGDDDDDNIDNEMNIDDVDFDSSPSLDGDEDIVDIGSNSGTDADSDRESFFSSNSSDKSEDSASCDGSEEEEAGNEKGDGSSDCESQDDNQSFGDEDIDIVSSDGSDELDSDVSGDDDDEGDADDYNDEDDF